MNEVQENISALQAAIDLVGRYPKHSDIKQLPPPRPQNENIAPIAAAAVAVSTLQRPTLDYIAIFDTIYNNINIVIPREQEPEPVTTYKPVNEVAAAAVATSVSSNAQLPRIEYNSIFESIYEQIKIKFAVDSPEVVPNRELSVQDYPFQEIYNALKIVLPEDTRKDPTNFVAAAAVAVTAHDKNIQEEEKENKRADNSPVTRNDVHLPLQDQLYLFTKLLINCIYVSDYNIDTELLDKNKSEFIFDKSKYSLADKIGDNIIDFYT